MKCPFCGNENLAGADACESCGEDLTAFDGVRPGTPLEKSLVKDTLEILQGSVPICVGSGAPLREVADHLAVENRSVLVMEGETMLGIVTECDLLFKIPEDAVDWAAWPVSRIMTPAPESLEFSDKIAYALHKMSIGGFRHIPLLKNGCPERVISVRDVLEYLAEMFPGIVGLHHESP